jgi:hypothetical protein
VNQGTEFDRSRLALADDGGADHEEIDKGAALGAPKSARKTKARLARATSLVVAARDRAAETAQRYVAQALARPIHPPTALQRRRVAERLNAKF